MTTSNTVTITGLPFTINTDCAGGAEPSGGLVSYINNLNSGTYGQIWLRADNGTTGLEMQYSGTTYTSIAGHWFPVSYFDSGADSNINGSILYRMPA